MKLRLLSFLPVIVFLSACGPKPVADDPEAREREIQRVVEARLAEERRADQEKELAARDQNLSEREREIKARERETERERQRVADVREAAARIERDASETADRQQPQPVAEQGPAQSYDLFYTSLDSHGDWIELGNYGYVFRPSAARSEAWRPYTNGYWAYSDYGWTWISNEPFGWATYHYGRWTRARGVGWVWVPGEEWAPAWVSWRSSDDYVGWAPLPPEAEYSDRVGISGWADSTYDIAPSQYTFVTVNNFSAPIVQNTIIAQQENVTIVNKTVNVTNIRTRNSVVINEGPSFNTIKARSGRNIQKLTIERARGGAGAATVVKGDRIQISAPVINRRAANAKPARVKERVQNASIETGWADVSDAQAAKQLRQKMNADAVTAKAAPPERQPVEPRQPRNVSQQPSPVQPQDSTPVAADPGPKQREAAREAREQQLRQQRENARQAAAEQQQRRREAPQQPAQPNPSLITPDAVVSPVQSIRQPSTPGVQRVPSETVPQQRPDPPDATAGQRSAAAAEARRLQQLEAQKQRQEQQQQQNVLEQRREAAQAARKQQQEAGEKAQPAGQQRRQQPAETARESNRKAPVASPAAPVAVPSASPAR